MPERIRDFRDRRIAGLVENGYSEDEAKRLLKLESDAQFEVMQAIYEARRNGESLDPFTNSLSAQTSLRDEIISYNGERTFSMTDLRVLTMGGDTGESAIIEIDRDGVRMQLSIPRGPIGMNGNGAVVRTMTWWGG